MKTAPLSVALALLGLNVFSACNAHLFTAERDFEKVIPVNSQVEVNVKTFNGNIVVTPTDQSEIEVLAHAKAFGSTQQEADDGLEALIPVVDTSTEEVTIECKKATSAMMMNSSSVSLEIKVPATWPLNLVTSNGVVTTSQSRGPVTIDTSNGKIEVKGAAGPLQLSTSNGKITIEDSSGNIQADSSNGNIHLLGCTLEGKCKLATSNGSINVGLSDRAPISLDASTSNGSIRLNEIDFDVKKKSKNQVAGVMFGKVVDSAPIASLELDTSNGSITIKPRTEIATPEPTTRDTSAHSN